MEKQVGKFQLEVSEGGYPVWTQLAYEGRSLHGVRHDELRDLEYAIQAAIKAANAELKRFGQEQI